MDRAFAAAPETEELRPPPRRKERQPRFWLAEGWDVLTVHVLLVGCAAAAVQTSGWDDLRVPLPVLAALASLAGIVIAKTEVPDAVAHLLALTLASSVSLVAVSLAADELGGSIYSRAKILGQRSFDWYLAGEVRAGDDSLLVSLLMGTLIWLLAYLSAWTLFRRGWLFSSLLLPGFLLLVNLGYAPDPESGAVVVFLLGSGILAARYHLFRRQCQWTRWGMTMPSAMASRFFTTGAVVATLAVAGGWVAPQSLARASLEPVLSRFQEPLMTAERALTGWWEGGGDGSGTGSAHQRESGRYSNFDDSFSIGGPLRLSDEPAVLLQADQPSYLVAQHYDAYSGSGWSSTVESTFDGRGQDGQTYSPEMTFQAGQRVPLSTRVRGERSPVTGVITALAPRGDIMFTTDTYVTADVPTSVRLSWRTLDAEHFDLTALSVAELPPDLQRIAILLGRAEFVPGSPALSPPATDAELQAEIEAEQAQLTRRFLDVQWEAADASVRSLIVSGQMPVYDDVEAVFARGDILPGTTYTITGLASTALPDQLRSAGTDYPAYIQQRYLQLPPTITPRTVQLSEEVTRDSQTPFDVAVAIESYLRETIAYVEDVPVPPEDQDVVDYVLFDDQRGYCEYYAAAMAVMLRTQGIPARVAVGYYPAPYSAEQGGYLYRQRNAHAWVEVFFPSYGWISFEPTASQPTRDYGEGFQEPLVETTPPAQQPPVLEDGTLSADPATFATPPASLPGITTTPETNRPGGLWLGVGVALLAGSAALAGLLFVLWVLPLRGLSPGDALYARLLRFGRLIGMRPNPATTPNEFAHSLGDAVPATRRPAMQIVRVYEVNRYGQRGADAGLMTSATAAWRDLRRQVLAARWRVMRWRRLHDDE